MKTRHEIDIRYACQISVYGEGGVTRVRIEDEDKDLTLDLSRDKARRLRDKLIRYFGQA